jgi:hypothetical protein
MLVELNNLNEAMTCELYGFYWWGHAIVDKCQYQVSIRNNWDNWDNWDNDIKSIPDKAFETLEIPEIKPDDGEMLWSSLR